MSEENNNPVTLQSLAVDVAELKVDVAWLKRLMIPNFIVTLITLLVAVMGVYVRIV